MLHLVKSSSVWHNMPKINRTVLCVAVDNTIVILVIILGVNGPLLYFNNWFLSVLFLLRNCGRN